MKSVLVLLALMLTTTAINVVLAETKILIGEAELLYTNKQLPFAMDGSFATLKKSNSEMVFFNCGGWDKTNYRYHGPLDAPLKTREWRKKDPKAKLWDYNGWYADWRWAYFWILNIYKISDDELLAFLHVEKFPGRPSLRTCHYAIGIGHSNDRGDSWKYCGETIKPQNDKGNIGGVPYLVIGDWFYVYYNETPTKAQRRISVAQAKVRDVVHAAQEGKVAPWKKYNSGTWVEDGLTGVGSNIIPDMVSKRHYGHDLHSDAAYCRGLGKYMLTVQTSSLGKLLLYTAADGIHWANPIIVDDTGKNSYWHAYSFFAALSDATDDCREVGSDFYIYYPRKTYNRYSTDQLYRRRVLIKSEPSKKKKDNASGK